MQAGDTVTYVSPKTGRQTEVTILSIGIHDATVAQVADPSKTLTCRVTALRTREQLAAEAERAAAERSRWSGLNEMLAADEHECAECGMRYADRAVCPRCGSDEQAR